MLRALPFDLLVHFLLLLALDFAFFLSSLHKRRDFLGFFLPSSYE
jgi:hypothetical protein